MQEMILARQENGSSDQRSLDTKNQFVSWDSGPAWLSFAHRKNDLFIVGGEI